MTTDNGKQGWQPTRNDWVFMLIVLTVIVVLILGTSERTTKATPDDATHQAITSHQACMTCHGEHGIRPQPAGHVKATQCFQCHQQPAGWKGA